MRRHANDQLKRFASSAFQQPDAFFWPGYMWAWNDVLAKEKITAQLVDMRAHGALSVWPLPVPAGFRPGSMPTAMAPDYLTDEYLERMRYTVEEAARLGMKVWLYDEGGWPSGMVCGRLVRRRPELARQSLQRQEVKPAAGEVVVVPHDCLVAFAYDPGGTRRRLAPGTVEENRASGVRLELFFASRLDPAVARRHPPADALTLYPDLLNPQVTREFLRLTHEPLRRAVGGHFGGTAPLIFTDEAGVANPPWTSDLARDFRRRKGYDILERLPDLFQSDQADGMQTRVDFFDWWSRRFADAFFGQILTWCRRNGILSAGHLGGDGDGGTLGARLYGFGHPLRALRKLDIPGVDAIWRQIFPGPREDRPFISGGRVVHREVNVNHFYPKYASTVAHQAGTPWALTESFAIYGSGLTPAEMKWVTDFQYVRGLNLMSMGGCQLSTRGPFMGAFRPMQGPFNPLWNHMDLYHGYVARLSWLLTLGKPEVDTALYYPVRDLWAGGPELGSVVEAHDSIARRLLETQRDFDLVDDDALEARTTRIAGDRLRVGAMHYRTIVVSKTRWMTDRSREVLRQSAAQGGRVIWLDAADAPVPPEAVVQSIAPLVHVAPVNPAIRVCKRRLANGLLYFITNEGLSATTCRAQFTESRPLHILDPETGACYRPADAAFAGGTWSLPLHLDFAGSVVVFFAKDALSALPSPAEPGEVLCNLREGWTCRRLRSCRLGTEDYEVEEMDEAPGPAGLGDWRSRLGEGFSGDAEYRVSVELDQRAAQDAAFLDLGKVGYVCAATVNGTEVGRRAWPPYVLPVAGRFRAGGNEIRVVVTNTLANQFMTSKVLDRWPENVVGVYHNIAKAFESDSRPSGLFGPVQLMACRSGR